MNERINGIRITELTLLASFDGIWNDQYISQIDGYEIAWNYYDSCSGIVEEIGYRDSDYDFIEWHAITPKGNVNGNCEVLTSNWLPGKFVDKCAFYRWCNTVDLKQIEDICDSLEKLAEQFSRSEDKFMLGEGTGIRRAVAMIRSIKL